MEANTKIERRREIDGYITLITASCYVVTVLFIYNGVDFLIKSYSVNTHSSRSGETVSFGQQINIDWMSFNWFIVFILLITMTLDVLLHSIFSIQNKFKTKVRCHPYLYLVFLFFYVIFLLYLESEQIAQRINDKALSDIEMTRLSQIDKIILASTHVSHLTRHTQTARNPPSEWLFVLGICWLTYGALFGCSISMGMCYFCSNYIDDDNDDDDYDYDYLTLEWIESERGIICIVCLFLLRVIYFLVPMLTIVPLLTKFDIRHISMTMRKIICYVWHFVIYILFPMVVIASLLFTFDVQYIFMTMVMLIFICNACCNGIKGHDWYPCCVSIVKIKRNLPQPRNNSLSTAYNV